MSGLIPRTNKESGLAKFLTEKVTCAQLIEEFESAANITNSFACIPLTEK
jgi:hypothetical protein